MVMLLLLVLLLELALLLGVHVRVGDGGDGGRGRVELGEDGGQLDLAAAVGVGRRGRSGRDTPRAVRAVLDAVKAVRGAIPARGARVEAECRAGALPGARAVAVVVAVPPRAASLVVQAGGRRTLLADAGVRGVRGGGGGGDGGDGGGGHASGVVVVCAGVGGVEHVCRRADAVRRGGVEGHASVSA